MLSLEGREVKCDVTLETVAPRLYEPGRNLEQGVEFLSERGDDDDVDGGDHDERVRGPVVWRQPTRRRGSSFRE
ncbi:MAG: hypothetical protein AAGF11_55915 [Myxococcota bacterium]